MSDAPSFRIRPAGPPDVPFILNSWLRHYHEHGEGARHIPNPVFFSAQGHHGLVTHLLNTSSVLVACTAEDENAILGWVCAAPPVLHYVYVKAPFRGLGIGAALLSAAIPTARSYNISVTHWTPKVRAWRERGRAYTYNPYLAGALAGAST